MRQPAFSAWTKRPATTAAQGVGTEARFTRSVGGGTPGRSAPQSWRQRWLSGPPYAAAEEVFDASDFLACLPVPEDARLHFVGLNWVLWCRGCGEPPFTGWVTTAVAGLS